MIKFMTHRAMSGRDFNEKHRVATPLELFFDLIYVIAIASATAILHHNIAEHHFVEGIFVYAQAFFFLWWAWMNFTWFASAYDTDDTYYCLLTMLQMLGSLILAAGLDYMITDPKSYTLGLIGFIIMRVAMVFQWLRASKEDPIKSKKKTCKRYAIGITITQLCWVAFYFSSVSVQDWLVYILILAEVSVPVFAEGKRLSTTWHPHHIAERYGLLVIIVLGELLLGLTKTVKVLVDMQASWIEEILPLTFCAIAIIFTLWWIYFQTPWAKILEKHRTRTVGFIFGYGHYFLFASIAAVGAGLELVADSIRFSSKYIEDITAHSVSPLTAITTLSLSISVFLLFNTLIKIAILDRSKYHLYALAIVAIITVVPIMAVYFGLSTLVVLFILLLEVIGYLFINSYQLCINGIHKS